MHYLTLRNKRGIKENTTGKTKTLELGEEIERKECPEPDCKSKKFHVFMADKDTVFYPSSPNK